MYTFMIFYVEISIGLVASGALGNAQFEILVRACKRIKFLGKAEF
jgi:hypothetical protein